MYASYFGLREKPFNATPDPRFFYANRGYNEAYATLLYGIRERKGFIVLTGEVGTGKTTLLRRLMENMNPAIKVVFVYNTALEFDELVKFICAELTIPVSGLSRLGRLQALNTFLLAENKQGGTVVLLLDEAQNLSAATLENLRLISNLETATAKLLQIVLVGQPELESKLTDPALRQVTQRITVRQRLERLSDGEVEPFIDHRLRVMGRQRRDLFTDDAIRKLIPYVNGIPRLINVVCDNALLVAYGLNAGRVTGRIIDEVVADLRLRPPGPAAGEAPTPSPVERHERQRAGVSSGAESSADRPRFGWVGVASAALVGLTIGVVVSWDQPRLGSLADRTLAWVRQVACATGTVAARGFQEPDARGPASSQTPSIGEQIRRHRDGERLTEQRAQAPSASSPSPQPRARIAKRQPGVSNSPPAPSESSAPERKAAAASQPLRDPPTLALESPRWDGASIAPLMHAVVDVRPSRRPSLRGEPEVHPAPSRGFIIDGQGYIVTSDKISGASSIEVTLYDGRVLGATVVARDRLNAVAVLKVERRGLPAMTLGDSGALAVGERVLAIGHGGGRDGTSTAVTVLATGAGAGGHLAVDLPPKPERVGGPLVNHLGQAVGIVTDNGTPTNGQRALTLAVSADRVKSLLKLVPTERSR